MKGIGWKFPPLSSGPKQGYTNNDIEGFKGEELIDNLAREICQNSLDAHNNNVSEPVKVVFELKQVENNFAVFSQYEKCLRSCRKYWSRGGMIDEKLETFLAEAEATLNKEQISILVASDYNTKGLTGNHDMDSITSPWEALTGADGMSVKPDDNSGGSFGIGKNAPFACSALSMVFYNTLDIEKNDAFIGVGRLATLFNENDKPTQRVGRYQKNDDEMESWTPLFKKDNDPFKSLFVREEMGTDVIIVGFSEVDCWQDNISKAVIKNFFVAINEKKLVVVIKSDGTSMTIDETTLPVKIGEYAKCDKDLDITRQLYLALTEPDNVEKTIDVLGEKDAVEVYIKSDSSFNRTIANFRSTGMLVGKGYRRIFQHYAAVMIVRGENTGRLLRDTEPPRHNRWDYKLIKGENKKEEREKAKKVLDLLEQRMLELLKAQYEIPAGDSDDAVGVNAYLPDTDAEALPEEGIGTDILKVKVKIGKPKTRKNRSGIMNVPGENSFGEEVEGEAGNSGLRAGPGPSPGPGPFPGKGPGSQPGPNPGLGIPVDPSKGNDSGVAYGLGERIITIKELPHRRVFPISVSSGLYKIIVKPDRDYEKLYVECAAAGEDGKTDELTYSKFMYKGAAVNYFRGKAGPIQVSQNEAAEFVVTFNAKEKMGISLNLFDGGRK